MKRRQFIHKTLGISIGLSTLNLAYGNILKTLSQNPNCIGFHLCGAYLRNKVRKYGLKDAKDELDVATLAIKKINGQHQKWVKAL